MAGAARILITGSGAICAAGRSPLEIWETLQSGQSAIGPIGLWDTAGWPRRYAGEVRNLEPAKLLGDRKILKFVRRSDVFGLYAGGRAIEAAGIAAWRDGLDEDAGAQYSDRTGVYVGSGGGTYDGQYDYFPLMTSAAGDLVEFGRQLPDVVNPMWLLRALPNNVLCHIGIKYNLKGANACITNHSESGMLAVIEAAAGLRAGEADRAVTVAHDAPIEPQTLLYYDSVGVVAEEALRPFDAGRDGSLLGEGAGGLVLETEASAAARGVPVLGEFLGGGSTIEGEGLLPIREDGEGPAAAMQGALDDAGLRAADIGMIVAHANGTRNSDASEAAALRRVFGDDSPPVTGFKWAFGHLIAASGMLDTVLALEALRTRSVPGIATLSERDPTMAPIPVSARAQTPRSDIALIVSRGFGGTNAALVIRAASAA
ncbi:MAG: beta-ketoacyl synthase N-terminal-like domain-containing protein [Burkholderiales bacterium]